MNKEAENPKDKKTFLSWKYFVFIIIIIIGLTSFFILQNKDYETYSADYKEIVSGFNTKALVIRDEKTYEAPISGELNILLNEGQRAPYGEKIAYIENEDNQYNIYTTEPGIISYAFDGLEQRLKFGNITPEVLKNYDEYKRDYKQYISGNKIQKGDKLYRNINNYQQYLLIRVNKDIVENYSINETVFVDRDSDKNDDNLIRAKIKKIYKNNEHRFLLLDLDSYVEMWNNTRWVNIKLIKNIYRGLAVPNSAVFKTTEGNQVLIYTFDQEVKLRNVEIVESTNDWIIVNNIDIGDQIIVNPEKANFGRNE